MNRSETIKLRTKTATTQSLLQSIRVTNTVVEYRRGDTVFTQGDAAESVIYNRKGDVKLTVVNESGKEAVVAMIGPEDFCGEGCMAGQKVRMATATAITPATIVVIEKEEMRRALHDEYQISEIFIAYTLSRDIRVEEDLIDHLFNSSEKRLARTLLLLAHYGEKDEPQRALPKVSQEMLAKMIGTTRSRVNFFMNKFRKLGLIEYNGEIRINKPLLNIVLHE